MSGPCVYASQNLPFCIGPTSGTRVPRYWSYDYDFLARSNGTKIQEFFHVTIN
jgi:hypothetical protein